MYVVVVMVERRNLYEVGVGKREKLGEEAGKETVYFIHVFHCRAISSAPCLQMRVYGH